MKIKKECDATAVTHPRYHCEYDHIIYKYNATADTCSLGFPEKVKNLKDSM